MISDLALTLAKEVRVRIEKWCKDNPEIYSNMEGACGIASYTLWKVYQAFKIQCDLAGNDGHCFVILNPKKVIVDLTATQFFEAPPVFIIEWEHRLTPPKSNMWGYYDAERLNNEVVADFVNWPRDQRPYQFENKIKRLTKKLRAKHKHK